MDPLTLLAIGAGVGLLKSAAVDAPAADRKRKLASATQRYAPWTGLKADPVQEADPLGSALQFGTTGAMLGSNIQNAEASRDLMKAQSAWLNSGRSPMYTNATRPWSLGVNTDLGL